jgi:hypothetical protein
MPKKRCNDQAGPNKHIIDSFSQVFTPPIATSKSKAETATSKFLEMPRLLEWGEEVVRWQRTAVPQVLGRDIATGELAQGDG